MIRFNPLDHPVCLTLPRRVAPSAWTEHVPFAMWLVDVLRPRVLVELGSLYGVSYCAFCQAVAQLGTETRCFAVDSWQGDAHSGLYDTSVLDDLRRHHDPLYGAFSRLVRSDFDAAAAHFADDSVDLLHIDGYHTYEAVRHDFETWLPRMTRRGVILFHDTNVRERDFGVWRFWDEVKARHPHFEVAYGHGLGLLATGEDVPEGLRALLDAPADELARAREFFFQLGRRVEVAQELAQAGEQLAALREEMEATAEREGRRMRRQGYRVARVWADEGAGEVARRAWRRLRRTLAPSAPVRGAALAVAAPPGPGRGA